MGGAASDDPNVAIVGRNVLANRGTAVDAAAAMFFTLSVSLPSQSSLMAGGMCLVHDGYTKETRVMDMHSRVPASAQGAERPTAIPTAVRGFYAMHARYGNIPWSQVVAPAEKMARFGVPVSRTLVNDLLQVQDALLVEPSVVGLFTKTDGSMIREGDHLTNPALADILRSIRLEGPKAFYEGPIARRLVQGAAVAGGSLTLEDLKNALPKWQKTLKIAFDNNTAVHFPPPPAAAGLVAAQIWAMMTRDELDEIDDLIKNEDYGGLAHLFAESAMRAYADRARWMNPDGTSKFDPQSLIDPLYIEKLMVDYSPSIHTPADKLATKPVEILANPTGTSFVVVDRIGSGVACTLGMNNLFGIGRAAGDTGILLAAAPGPGGRGPYSMTAALAVHHGENVLFFAGASAHGVTSPTALVSTAARLLTEQATLDEAMQGSRIHHSGAPDLVFHEKGLEEKLMKALVLRDHKLAETGDFGRVNAVFCAGGLPGGSETCTVLSDPRGTGLGMGAHW